MIFNRVVKNIETNKKIKDSGGFNSIPWLRFPKFSTVLPGVMKGKYYLVTANSKIGKSQLTDWLFVLEPYNFINKFPSSKIDIDIDFFLLEMSKEEKITKYLSHFLFVDFGIRISPDELMSMYKDKTVTDEIFSITKSRELSEKFESFESKIKFHDTVKNPYGIFKECKKYAETNGFWVDKTGRRVEWEEFKKKNTEVHKHLAFYKPNNPNIYKINIVDHTSLLSPEKGHNLHYTMGDWSANRALDLKNKYGHTMVDVQQQSSDSEKQQFTFKGQSVIEKVKPSLDGLGDNKTTQRNTDVVLGLFFPTRYNISEYPQFGDSFKLNQMGDAYRELSILANRAGGGLHAVDLYYDGAVEYFKELPPPGSLTPTDYRNIYKRNVKVG
jgi:hypothetical protein